MALSVLAFCCLKEKGYVQNPDGNACQLGGGVETNFRERVETNWAPSGDPGPAKRKKDFVFLYLSVHAVDERRRSLHEFRNIIHWAGGFLFFPVVFQSF